MGRKEEKEGEGGWGEECVRAHTPLINGICSEEKDLLLRCEVVFFHFTFEDGRDCACRISWKIIFGISVTSLSCIGTTTPRKDGDRLDKTRGSVGGRVGVDADVRRRMEYHTRDFTKLVCH